MKTKFLLDQTARRALVLFLLLTIPPTFSAHAEAPSWKPLFDGKSLDGWKITQFGGQGEVHVENGTIHLELGVALTGVTYTNEIPKMNYEIRVEARKLRGNDFFSALTFPVGDSHATFVAGGWGGGVVGISSVDGMDASENETTQYMRFDPGQWYQLWVRVTEPKLEAWIDDLQVVNLDLEDRKISMRLGDIELSKPLGIAAWQTQSEVRKIQFRKVESAPAP